MIKLSPPVALLPYSVSEEIANTLSHGLGALLSFIALFFLINNAMAQNDLLRLASFLIYGLSLLSLFLASTLYHGVKSTPIKKTFKLLDHCAIYILIAGTYTPLLLLSLDKSLGYWMLILIWGIAVAGILFKIKFGQRYKKISLMTYLGMGFISLGIINELYRVLSTSGLTLLALGGFIYAFGVIFYVKKSIPFNHAIWHLFVLAGASCHFFMVYYL